MSELVYNNILTVGYLFLWIGTFVWYHWRRPSADAGSAIMLTYIVYSIFSILTINDSFMNVMFKPLELFPYLFLYVMLMMALSPTFYHHFHPVSRLQGIPSRLMYPYCFLMIFFALLLLPNIMSNFQDGLVKLITDVDAGKETYEEHLEDVSDAGSAIGNLAAIIFNAFYDFTIFVAFYMIALRKNIFLILGLLFAVLMGVLTPIINGQRGPVIITVTTVFSCFMLFKPYLKRTIVRFVTISGFVGVLALAVPIVAITMSRFGERTEGVASFLNWYVGQGNVYFNNYGLDAGGIRYGDRTLNIFKRLIDPSTPKNFDERRAKYHNLEMDDDRFTTFVGDFCIDFGPVLAFLIFLVFNLWVLYRIRGDDEEMPVHKLLLIYFTQCICMQGGMALFAYSDTGNFKIITTGMIYAYLCYHECLLKHFPKRNVI